MAMTLRGSAAPSSDPSAAPQASSSAIPSFAKPPQRSRSYVESLTGLVSGIFNRSDESVKARQDALFNIAIFGTAVFLIHRYGYKLAI